MNKRLFALLLSCILLSCLPFTMTVSAQPISITPDEIHVVGNIGDLVILSTIDQQVTITNKINETVTVSVNYSGMNKIFMPSSSIDISANGEKDVNIGFIIAVEEIAWITYSVNSSSYSQLVSIEIKKADNDVTVFPSNPKPGKNVAFILTGEGTLNADGFLFFSESGSVDVFEISNGIGIYGIGENESGEVIARITGDDINPLFVNFTVASKWPSNDNGNNNSVNPPPPSVILSLSAPANIKIDETKDISVVEGTKPKPMTSILITKPSGDSSEMVTNSFGKINIFFNEIGTWQATIVSGDQIISKNIVCSKKQDNLVLLTNDPKGNMPVEIQVFQDSVVTVTYPNGYVKTGVDNGGTYLFTPTDGGKYSIHAESSSSVGDISFDVKTRPRIIITDMNGNLIDYKSDIGKMVYLRIVDSDNNPLNIDTVLKVLDSSTPFGIPDDVNIFESIGMWTPHKSGTYSISFPGYGFYASTESSLVISDRSFNIVDNLPYVVVGAIIIGVVLAYRGKFIAAWFRTTKIGQRFGRGETQGLEPK